MTVSTAQTYVQYTGNGASTSFPFPFNIPDQASLLVTLTSPAGVVTSYPASNYTVSGLDQDSGGTLTTNSPITLGWILTISRNMSFTQTTSFPNDDALWADLVQDAIDRAAMRDQQLLSMLTALLGTGQTQLFANLNALFANLPTTLPASKGQLWNNSGVLSIS